MTPRPAPPKPKPFWRYLLLGCLAVLVCFTLRKTGSHFKVSMIRHWLEDRGPYGPVCFCVLYVLGVLVAVPESALTAVAGTIFHPRVGIGLVSAASLVAAGLSFLIARYAARHAVEEWLGSSVQFRRLNRLTQTHGALLAFVTRLLPIFPYTVLNYGFGLTRVSFPTYLLWSWLGMQPGIVIYVLGVDGLARGLAHGRIAWEYGSGLAVLVIGLALLSRRAWQYLSEPDEQDLEQAATREAESARTASESAVGSAAPAAESESLEVPPALART